MQNITIAFCCFALLLATPAYAEEKPEEVVPGIWVLSGIVINDKAIEDDDLGKRIIVFTEDGIMAAFEDKDAFLSFEPDDAGWFELGEDSLIILYEDRNENEKLDDKERERAERMTWSKDGEKLILTMILMRGEEKMVVQTILKPFQNDN